MKTSTVVVIGVVAVAGIGGLLYWQYTKAKKAAAAAAKPKSTADKVVGVIAASIPLAGKIAQLF